MLSKESNYVENERNYVGKEINKNILCDSMRKTTKKIEIRRQYKKVGIFYMVSTNYGERRVVTILNFFSTK